MFYKSLAVILIIIVSVLVTISNIDLTISRLFYQMDNGFYLMDDRFFRFLYDIIPIMALITSILLVIVNIYYLIKKKNNLSKPFIYLLLALVIGPGLTVNLFFKEYIGRARPREIIEFSGDRAHSSAFLPSDQCKSNCSFPSGHAAMAFYYTSLAFIYNNIYVWGLTLLFGCLVGIARIVQGGHFFSDVYFAALFVISINYFCYKRFYNAADTKLINDSKATK